MNAWRFNNHIHDALRATGSALTIDLDERNLSNLKKIFSSKNKEVITQFSEVNGELAFLFVNTKRPIGSFLEKIWDKMSWGSTIFFSEYAHLSSSANNKIITEFLKNKELEISSARQMLLNGLKEVNLVVKCFPKNKKPEFPLGEKSITIATVLKSGGAYDVDYVNHIANSVKKYTTIPYKFVCLTDCFEGYNKNVHQLIPFEHNFSKWWGKMELFAPRKFSTERIFYIDLDTLIVDNIDNILKYDGKFFGLRDFYHQYGLGSGLMAWENNNPKIFQIYERFMSDSTANINNHLYGDQEFIRKTITEHIDYVQDFYPKEVVSYKKDCTNNYKQTIIPDNAKIICFHGPPRPKELNDPIVKKYWIPHE